MAAGYYSHMEKVAPSPSGSDDSGIYMSPERYSDVDDVKMNSMNNGVNLQHSYCKLESAAAIQSYPNSPFSCSSSSSDGYMCEDLDQQQQQQQQLNGGQYYIDLGLKSATDSLKG